jgi:hypothetical protein
MPPTAPTAPQRAMVGTLVISSHVRKREELSKTVQVQVKPIGFRLVVCCFCIDLNLTINTRMKATVKSPQIADSNCRDTQGGYTTETILVLFKTVTSLAKSRFARNPRWRCPLASWYQNTRYPYMYGTYVLNEKRRIGTSTSPSFHFVNGGSYAERQSGARSRSRSRTGTTLWGKRREWASLTCGCM